jgi:hypothetical protein
MSFSLVAICLFPSYVLDGYIYFTKQPGLIETSFGIPYNNKESETSLKNSNEKINLPETLETNLVSIQKDKASSWSRTNLKILVELDGVQKIRSDLPVLEAVGSAVSQWRISITDFTEKYPEYKYLENLNLTLYVYGYNESLMIGAEDIIIRFTDDLSSPLIGRTRLAVTTVYSIAHAEVTIDISELSLLGLHNVLTHELGHTLGLEHSDISYDLMFSEREVNEVSTEVLCPSTLDIYALTQTYQWIKAGEYSSFDSVEVATPEDIEYGEIGCIQQ